MRVLLSGSSGLIGKALRARLEAGGHEVVRLVRRPPGPGEVRWDPAEGSIDRAGLGTVDAAVHLAGESIGAKVRWSDEHKERVRQSRVRSTEVLADALAAMDPTPATLLSGSAVGYYGDRGDERLTEGSRPGQGFMAGLCVEWEDATRAAQEAGIRVVHLRTGLVLDAKAGILPKLLAPGRFGLGAHFGSGRQYMSWITLADEVSAIVALLDDAEVRGAVNLTAPDPVTNAEFTRCVGRVLRRPAVLSVPAVVLKAVLGEAADELLLSGQRVLPTRLEASGFTFEHPHLEAALTHLLR